MQAASQQMYSQAGGAQAGPGAGFQGGTQGAQPGSNTTDNDVQDVDFEEVK
jgi:molecular chaperone DnaK